MRDAAALEHHKKLIIRHSLRCKRHSAQSQLELLIRDQGRRIIAALVLKRSQQVVRLAHLCVSKCECVCVCECEYARICACEYVCVCACVYMYMCKCMCEYVYVKCMCVCMYLDFF